MLFDSLGHATVDGNWLETSLDASFKSYSHELTKNNYLGGLAVGLSHKNDYNHDSFIKNSDQYQNIYPIAGFDPLKEDLSSLAQIKKLGFYGIKLHPRFTGLDLKRDKEILIECLNACGEIKIPVFLCSYFYCNLNNMPTYDPFFQLIDILKQCLKTKVIIVHGGGLEIMRYVELSRFNANILLDLSLVFMKYKNSSIDKDIQFLFESFDQRISIGSDFPEYNLSEIQKRFDYFSKDISLEKRENIGFKNITNFLGIIL